MCAIAGLIDLGGRWGGRALGELAVRMRDTMVHRGPDGAGVWVSPDSRVAFAHRRLSIIDTSEGGHQPMLSQSGSAITFNGEIYNFEDLREELAAAGSAFATRSDTEVLLTGLDEQGADFLARVDGMYAFAHWDGRSGRVMLARDRFGEKPLYLYRGDGLLAFASEMSAFAVLPDFDDRIGLETIASYLCFQYVPAPRAMYDSAAKLEPGRCVAVEADGSLADLWRWRFVTSPAFHKSRKIEDLADQLEDILVRAVRQRLISDVPLGAFLSGGVDSGTVVAMVTKRLNRNIKTFSIGFDGAADSEHEFAREFAQHLGTDHYDQIVPPCSIGDAVTLIGGVLDEPNGDSSCMPTHLLSQLARRQVTVALSGDGGDEMFGGYGRYFSTLMDEAKGHVGWRPGKAYVSSRLLVFGDADLTNLFGQVPPALADMLATLRMSLDEDARPLMNRLRAADAESYLPGAVLAKVDRMSMRHSLEARSPLLGNDVAAFAAGLAQSECWDGMGAGKLVLKTVARRYLKPEWIDRRKMGFGLPMRGWAEGTALEAARNLLSPGNRLAQWIGQEAIDRFVAAQQHSPMLYQLWAMLVLETWLRSHSGRPA